MNILVTGGAGYVGSVCAAELLRNKHQVITYDNLSAGLRRSALPGITFVKGDIADHEKLDRLCRRHRIEVVMHFAGSILVGESVRNPRLYYQNNVSATLVLLDVMVARGIKNIVFSSSAAVYGEPKAVPITEDHPTSPINAYGETKLVIERALAWYQRAYGLNCVALRYFNAAGAVGALGENHHPETHLIPRILGAALDSHQTFHIYGDDYPTPDGTCVRDFVHVLDIARAHILAMRKLPKLRFGIYNIGHGRGYSIREVLRTVEEVTGIKVAAVIAARRSGDPAVLLASPAKIQRELGWRPRASNLRSIVRSAWEWHSRQRRRKGDGLPR
jgi:UDP-glucose 4-epimerase